MIRRFRTYFRFLRVWKALLLIAGFTGFLLYVLSVVNRQPYVLIEANTGILSYKVQRDSSAGIAFRKAKLKLGNDKPRENTTGVLFPPKGSVVTYRLQSGELSIRVKNAGTEKWMLKLDAIADAKIDKTEYGENDVSINVTDIDVQAAPLPIAGPADIGVEIASPTGGNQIPLYLRSGNVHIMGRSFSCESGTNTLYPLGSSFPVPVGGRISSGDSLDPKTGISEAPGMFGVAEAKQDGLHVSVSTVTKELYLYRPGRLSEKEVLGIGFFAQAVSDPILVGLVICFSLFTFIVQLIVQPLTLLEKVKEGKGKKNV